MVRHMPYRIDMYIGSDNGSRRIDDTYLNKIQRWANEQFPDGYTILRGQGCYLGVSEDTVLINALSKYDVALRDQLEKLKHDLGQEAILMVRAEVDFELV
jgi:hypothetical protein